MPDQQQIEIRRLVDDRCDRFEQAWNQGERPATADFLQDCPLQTRSLLLVELLSLELELRVRAGESPGLEEYLNTYSSDETSVRRAFREFRDWETQNAAFADEETIIHDAAADRDTLTVTMSDTASMSSDPQQAFRRETVDPDIPSQIGRYEVVRKLGQGGMGTVLLAHDPALDRLVALKLPEFAAQDSDVAIERFRREARAMATVRHPNLCPIHDVGEHDGQPYLAMAYIDGPTLSERIRLDGPMPADDAARLVGLLATAMDAAHRAGVLHRDLKPSNVMLDRDGQPVITDFGLASRDRPAESDLTTTGVVVGSPAYMAPEQISDEGDSVGPHTDVYALGVVLYELLTAQRPFKGNRFAVLGEITSGRRPAAPAALTTVPAGLNAICMRAMSHDVAARYQSAAELAAALTDFRCEESVQGSGFSITARLMVVLLLVAGAAIAVNWYTSGPARNSFRATLAEKASTPNVLRSPVTVSSDAAAANAGVLSFDGVSSYAVVPGLVRSNAGPMTLEAWVRPEYQEAARAIAILAGEHVLELAKSTGKYVAVESQTETTTTNNLPFFNAGQWDHIAIVCDTHEVRMYINGIEQLTTPRNPQRTQSPSAFAGFWLGAHPPDDASDSLTYHFEGCISEVRVSDFARYSASFLPELRFSNDEHTVALYHCDQQDGKELIDSSGRNNHGQLHNVTWRSEQEAKFPEEFTLAKRRNPAGTLANIWTQPHVLPQPLNTGDREGAPTFFGDTSEIVFHRPHPKTGNLALWTSSRPSSAHSFAEPQLLKAANAPAFNTRNPKFTPDGLTLVFDSDRIGGSGQFDCWIMQRAALDAAWQEPQNLGNGVNTEGNDTSPILSVDGLQLIFSSDRPGGFGSTDIWIAQRESPDDGYSEPVNAGSHVNTQMTDRQPWMTTDGLTLLYSSDRSDGFGGYDLWLSHRVNTRAMFGPAVNLGAAVNSEMSEYNGYVTDHQQTLFFESDRHDGLGLHDIWTSRRVRSDPALSTNPFVDSGQELGRAGARAVAAGDIDNDGDIDMVVANGFNSRSDQVWLNDGDGGFTAGQEFTGITSTDVGLADLNGDGNLDVVLTPDGTDIAVWENDGAGQFTMPREPRAGSSKCLALGDLDGDGDIDVVVGTDDSPLSNRVLFNDGNGQLTDSDQQLGSSKTLGIALADFDADGDLDMFAANWIGGNSVWLNDGQGVFTDSGKRLGDSTYVHVALGDVDHDGDIDACTTSPNEAVGLWLNDGHASFTWSGLSLAPAPALGVAIADFTGDQRNDVLLGNGDLSDGYPMFPNQLLVSTGTLTWESHWMGAEATAGFGVADLDGDGDLDAFLANGFRVPNRVWMNRSGESQTAAQDTIFRDSGQRLGNSSSTSVELVDIDGDHDLDALVANTEGPACAIWMNDGAAQYFPGPQLTTPLSATDLECGDVDSDGDLDIVLISRSDPGRIWLNNSEGRFDLSVQQMGAGNGNQVALADFDGDGDLDAWLGNYNPSEDEVWFNDGQGNFTDSGQRLGPDRVYHLTTVDIDGDGDLDVLKGTGSGYANSLWLNDGRGFFTRSEQDLNGTQASNGFFAGDLNGDGSPDLYSCGWSGSDSVWLNDGSGRLTITARRGLRMRSRRAGLADLDGDGDLDAVVGNEAFLPNAVCLNNGDGNFGRPVQFLGNVITMDVELGDLDGDGDIDLFTANNKGQGNRVWINTVK